MQFGITTSKIDEIGLIARAENLGYDFCWVTDSQMIRSNPWAVLALAAQQTRSIRIGTGVAVAAATSEEDVYKWAFNWASMCECTVTPVLTDNQCRSVIRSKEDFGERMAQVQASL